MTAIEAGKALVDVFGSRYVMLTREQRSALRQDIQAMLDSEEFEDALDAAGELRTRIGGVEVLESYARTIVHTYGLA